MKDKIVLYQRESSDGENVKHRFSLETYLGIAVSLIIATGIVFCISLLIDGVDSWNMKSILLLACIVVLMFGILVFQIAGIIETIKTDIIISSISLTDNIVTINYLRGRRKYSKEIKSNHINSEIGEILVYVGLNIRIQSYGVTILDYGFISIRQRIKNSPSEQKEVEKINSVIQKVRAESRA